MAEPERRGEAVPEPPLEEWLELAYRIEGRDPRWIAPMKCGVRELFSGSHPFMSRVSHRRCSGCFRRWPRNTRTSCMRACARSMPQAFSSCRV